MVQTLRKFQLKKHACYLTASLLLSIFHLGMAQPTLADSASRKEDVRQRINARLVKRGYSRGAESLNIAGMNVAIWQPPSLSSPNPVPAPLVIFSHGFRGMNTQSIFLMKAMAQAGYLVVAPNHRDAISYGVSKQQIGFFKVSKWNAGTYKDREEDVMKLIDALRCDPQLNAKIDWTKLALAGHSLGGYTVLGLAGAWPEWKLAGVKAVIALSPYSNPYIDNGTLAKIDVPVMFQSGTRDNWINKYVKDEKGAFAQTPSPAIYIELDDANHFAWTNLNKDASQKELICHYCIAFLNKYVLGDVTAKPELKLDGASALRAK